MLSLQQTAALYSESAKALGNIVQTSLYYAWIAIASAELPMDVRQNLIVMMTFPFFDRHNKSVSASGNCRLYGQRMEAIRLSGSYNGLKHQQSVRRKRDTSWSVQPVRRLSKSVIYLTRSKHHKEVMMPNRVSLSRNFSPGVFGCRVGPQTDWMWDSWRMWMGLIWCEPTVSRLAYSVLTNLIQQLEPAVVTRNLSSLANHHAFIIVQKSLFRHLKVRNKQCLCISLVNVPMIFYCNEVQESFVDRLSYHKRLLHMRDDIKSAFGFGTRWVWYWYLSRLYVPKKSRNRSGPYPSPIWFRGLQG